jgi:hypothetical protein
MESKKKAKLLPPNILPNQPTLNCFFDEAEKEMDSEMEDLSVPIEQPDDDLPKDQILGTSYCFSDGKIRPPFDFKNHKKQYDLLAKFII